MRQVQIEVKGMTFKSTFAGLRTKVLVPGEHVCIITTLICFDRILSSIYTKKREGNTMCVSCRLKSKV